jgi:hypothetical protein
VAEPQVARWGSTKTERRACWPGDELVDDPGLVWTNAVTIDRPASEVWPWIAQLGQGRGGLYSYDWLENLLGCDVHSARRVLPQFQEPLPVGADVAGLAGPLMVFAVPRPALRARPRPGPATGARGRHPPGRSVPPLDRRMVGWHVPGAYELALEQRWAHDLEHASMVLAGLLAWVTVMAAAPRRRMSPARRAGFAAGLFAVGLIVSQVLLLSGPLYGVYVEQPHRLLGLTPAADQARAALLMGTEQLMTFGLAVGVLLWSHVERVAGRPAPRSAKVDAAGGGADL